MADRYFRVFTIFALRVCTTIANTHYPEPSPMQPKEKRVPKNFRLKESTIQKINTLSEILKQDATAIVDNAVDSYFGMAKELAMRKIEQERQELTKREEELKALV